MARLSDHAAAGMCMRAVASGHCTTHAYMPLANYSLIHEHAHVHMHMRCICALPRRPVAFRERVDLHVECTWRHWQSRKLRPHVSERTCNAMLAHETITLNR